MKIIRLLLMCSILIITACDQPPRARQATFYAFGTEIDVSLYGVDAAAANNTVAALEQSFSQVNDTWHAWQPSTLTAINEAIANEQAITISEDVSELIHLAKRYAHSSQHLFNPAAGKLFELWGFHQDNWFESHPPPSQAEINHYLTVAPSMNDITIENGILASDNPMVKLGFGGFAKGYAVDSAIAVLQQQGIDNAIINIGGDLRVIGSHGKRPWIVGIRDPRREGMVASIALANDESVFTSGDYERFFTFAGKRYSHIIDPRTGWPADQAISVTVLSNNATQADAAATALFVAGDNWPEIAAAMALDHIMLIKPDGVIEMTPQMHARVQLIGKQKHRIIDLGSADSD